MKKTNKPEKKKQKLDPMKLFTRILAGILLAAMVIGSCYTVIYLLINK